MGDEPFAVGGTLVGFPVWLIAPDPPPKRKLALVKNLYEATWLQESEPVKYTPVFTDKEQAEWFVAKVIKTDDEEVACTFLRIRARIYLEALLMILRGIGRTQISIDPQHHRSIPICINRVIASLRERPEFAGEL
jgi:hypothetical protein